MRTPLQNELNAALRSSAQATASSAGIARPSAHAASNAGSSSSVRENHALPSFWNWRQTTSTGIGCIK
jgi:hypothetical protein